MTVASEWSQFYLSNVRALVPWMMAPVFVPRGDGVNAANIVGVAPLTISPPLAGSVPRPVTGPAGAPVVAFPPQSPVDADFVAHECGHAAHEVAARARDAAEGRGTAGTDIYAEVAAIVSPGVVWPSAGPDLRDEWTAEAFRKAVTGNIAQLRYPNPPGQVTPYPLAALRAYFGTMNVPRIAVSPPPASTVDIRALLPLEGNIYGTFSPKDSLTFHWNGGPVPSGDPLDILRADATYHIDKGWGGISYHGAIWTDGTLYITRDMDAVLAACGDAIGNARSRHIQVMVGVGQTVSPAQWARMAELASAATTVHPHKYWSDTACPGPEIEAWITERRWDDMTPAQEAKLDRVIALLEAEGPKIWIAREQRFLDVERGDAFNPNRAPIDPRIKP